MCYFITATLPPNADVERVRRSAPAAKYWAPIDNPVVHGQLDPGTSYFLTTRGHCDCGTVLGCLRHARERRRGRSMDDVAKLKAKGWTSASERLGLLLHDYEGAVDTDAVRVTRERIALGTVDAGLLMNLKDDVLYEFEAGAPASAR